MEDSLNKYDLLPKMLRTNCLHDRLSKKDLGAFYTAELVQMAVDRVPDGNDYIILDRCAGTGNLEAALIGLKDKNGDEVKVLIKKFTPQEHRIALSVKDIGKEPQETASVEETTDKVSE